MTEEEFLETQFPGLAAWIRSVAPAGAGSRVHECDGVVAQVSPALRDVSLFNSVTYRDAEALGAALPELADVYDAAGVRAWTVWIHDSDEEAAALVRDAGHVLDARPEGMGCSLDELIAPEGVDELSYTEDPRVEDLQEVLAHGYGMPIEATRRAMASVPGGPGTFVGLATIDGRPVSTVQVTILDGDAGVYGVATVPDARGRGLARRLQYLLLQRARELGARTTTLQATAAGRGVYTALGYGSFGPMNMWERRRPRPAQPRGA